MVVCGGTLGVFIAAALATRHVHTPSLPPLRVAVVERAPTLRGRAQEWNLSLKELNDLVALRPTHEFYFLLYDLHAPPIFYGERLRL